jgi:hypothetical protein
MISACLTSTQRLGNGQHVLLFEKAPRGGLHGVLQLCFLTRRMLLLH